MNFHRRVPYTSSAAEGTCVQLIKQRSGRFLHFQELSGGGLAMKLPDPSDP